MTWTFGPVTMRGMWQVVVLLMVFGWMTYTLWTDNREATVDDAKNDHPSGPTTHTTFEYDEAAMFDTRELGRQLVAEGIVKGDAKGDALVYADSTERLRICPICLESCEPGRRYCSERCFDADNPPQYDEDDWEPGDDEKGWFVR